MLMSFQKHLWRRPKGKSIKGFIRVELVSLQQNLNRRSTSFKLRAFLANADPIIKLGTLSKHNQEKNLVLIGREIRINLYSVQPTPQCSCL